MNDTSDILAELAKWREQLGVARGSVVEIALLTRAIDEIERLRGELSLANGHEMIAGEDLNASNDE